MKAVELMRNGYGISSATPIREAEKIFIERGVTILPVIERGGLVGVITRSDIARALPSDATTLSRHEIHYWLDEITIEEFMIKPVAISPDMELSEVARLATEKGVYNFPVIKGDKLMGMLYEEDLIRHLADEARRPLVKIEISVKEQKTSLFRRLIAGGAP